jgi:hypothetical protein
MSGLSGQRNEPCGFHINQNVRFQVLGAASMMFRIVFWGVLQCKEAVRTSETSVDNHFTRQYIPEDNSEPKCIRNTFRLLQDHPVPHSQPVHNSGSKNSSATLCLFVVYFITSCKTI